MKRLLVSSCLAGMQVRYNGLDNRDERVARLVAANRAVAVCPEVLGGLPIPRKSAEIVGGSGEDVLDGRARVINMDGEDVSGAFMRGAYETLRLARDSGATAVVLKLSSPSCGSRMIYDGTFCGSKIAGNGVTTALLRREGIQVFGEEEWEFALKLLEEEDERTEGEKG